MPKFRKKPVVIEAIFNDGTDEFFEELEEFCPVAIVRANRVVSVPTLEGIVDGRVGWWIVKGVMGECWPVRDDVFQQTYERVYEPVC